MKRFMMLIPAVAFLMCSCGNNTNNNATAAEGQDTETRREVSSQIAYIKIDTLLSHYDMFVELNGALEEKASKADSEITSKGRSLERAVADAQEKMEKGLITRAQAGELQEKLQRQEQNFYQFRDRMQQELMEENQVMMNNVQHNLMKFIEEFNKDYQYGMIITTTGGAPVIHADPALDITDIVVKALNEAYAKEKAANK